jgi:RNA polymerase sigma-70 factor (ECF subfamily)
MWPERNTTDQLLRAARGGDRAAVDALLQRHREALRRMVDMRLDPALARRLDASDIVQEVMLEANRRLDEYLRDPKMPFHLWLRHMARDRIIDAHRRHRVAARRTLDREQPLVVAGTFDHSTQELAAQLCDPELTPSARAAWHEALRRFQVAVEQLSDQDREIIFMRHFEQLSNQDAAAALGLSPPAASMRYLRALRRLRELLGQGDSSCT